MPSTEEQVKSVILEHKGGARKQQIARELKMGLGYIGVICQELKRKGEIVFSEGLYSSSISSDKYRKSKSRSLPSKTDTKPALLGIPKMTKEWVSILENAGYKTIEALADASIAKLMQETEFKLHEAAGLINRARKALGQIKDTEVEEEVANSNEFDTPSGNIN